MFEKSSLSPAVHEMYVPEAFCPRKCLESVKKGPQIHYSSFEIAASNLEFRIANLDPVLGGHA